MNEEFKAAYDSARRDMLKTVSDTDKRLATIYEQAARDLTARAHTARAGSLTERWANDYRREMVARVGQLNGQVTQTITGAAGSAAGGAANATTSWLDTVLAQTGSMKGGASFASVLSRTPDEALSAVVNGQAYLDGKKLSQRIWSHNGRISGGINEILEQGIAQKKSAFQIAKELEAFVNPAAREDYDWTKVYPDLPSWLADRWKTVEKNAQRVARTSINHAYHVAMIEAAKKNPFATAIHWALSPQHWERQIHPFGSDICDEYSIHNEGLGVGNWPIGKTPLPHACCLCTQYAVVPDSLDKCARELGDWLNGAPNPELDKAFGEWRASLPSEASGGTIAPSVTDFNAADRRTQLMNDVAGQGWTQQMSIGDRQAVFDVLANASEEELAYFAKHGAKIDGEFNYTASSAHYSPWDRRVHLNMAQQTDAMRRIGTTTNTITYFHEVGHLFDYGAHSTRLLNEMPDLLTKLSSDYIRKANTLLSDAGLNPITSLSRLSIEQKHTLIADLMNDPDIKSSVSDIVGGLTNKRVEGRWGHPASYWSRTSPTTEAVAEMFEAAYSKGERLDTMKAYFPDAYQYFVDTIRHIEGVK